MRREQLTLEQRWARFIATNDVECLSCGYNLRGLDGRVCPECGARIDPEALMYVGPESLLVVEFVQGSGVFGASAFAAIVHLIGLRFAPGVYLAVFGFGNGMRGFGAIDAALTGAMVTLLGFVIFARLSRRSGRSLAWFGRGTQHALAWCAWVIAGLKGAMLVLFGFVAIFG